MRSKHFIKVIFCISLTYCSAEDKWVWSKERKGGVIETETGRKTIINDNSLSSPSTKFEDHSIRLFNERDDYKKSRYDLREPVLANPRPFNKPVNSPRLFPNQRYYPDVPSFPDGSFPERYPPPPPPFPIPRPGPDEFIPTPIRIPPPAPGILTGPVPSWERPILNRNGDPTNFDHCKCSFSFNCKSPGIQFGSCDRGKTYCCSNEFTNIDRYDVGPGGGVGRPPGYRPYPPDYDYDADEDPLEYDGPPYERSTKKKVSLL